MYHSDLNQKPGIDTDQKEYSLIYPRKWSDNQKIIQILNQPLRGKIRDWTRSKLVWSDQPFWHLIY